MTRQTYLIAAYFVEFLLLAAVINILLIARHTRAEEQTGRAELLRAAVVGRLASLAAALLVSVITNTVPALLVAATTMGAGLPAGIALLFGASTAAMGLVFAGVTGVAVQFTQHSRAAGGIAALALFVVRLLREGVAGDFLADGPDMVGAYVSLNIVFMSFLVSVFTVLPMVRT
ncbi:hypothetical protein C1I98_14885 [Spongiactinospora gelatinilytica]|uniref:Uncharacterized protein n=1 Tax=Spongiactinospora gelatinilytica TaxID=2666298 RepID=A0A2W2GC45_9ACTN|nr:hypothetical protein [Spongiactinospora gelatinilytica]PZG45981.1 hypothetical protein C1I98_14885 [Spongiactinospora gelatinilytica]